MAGKKSLTRVINTLDRVVGLGVDPGWWSRLGFIKWEWAFGLLGFGLG